MKLRIPFLCMLLSAFCSGPLAQAAEHRRAIIISWDGAPDWIIDQMLGEGKLPNVARLKSSGMAAESLIPNFPSVTACGHAAIWTGAYGDVNGITGNTAPMLPKTEHTVLESRSGFSSESLLAEPIYLTAALAGRKVLVLSATHSHPVEPYMAKLDAAGVDRGNLVSFSGFDSEISRGKMFGAEDLVVSENGTRTIQTKSGDTAINIIVFDDPADPIVGFDSARIEVGGGEATILKPHEATANLEHFSPPLPVAKGAGRGLVYFRLFELAPDGSRFALYQRAVNSFDSSTTPEETRAYLEAAGGFHDAPFWTYADGAFGTPLWEGGDGTAENRLLELVRLDIELLRRGTRYGFNHWNPDLMFHYTLASDSAGHTWMGMLDSGLDDHDEELARKLRPYYENVLMLQDEWLGDIIDMAEAHDAIVCLVSDHGMCGVRKRFYPNAVLERAGLLFRTENNRIDLTRTKILASGWSELGLVVNTTDRKGGIVPPEQKAAVITEATEALLNAVDEETGSHLVTKVFDPTQIAGLGIGGSVGADLFVDLAPGYYWRRDVGDQVANYFDSRAQGQGMHGVFSYNHKMHAIWYMAGPGVNHIEIGTARQIDVAPTLARLLGIPAPAQAQGHVVGQALSGAQP